MAALQSEDIRRGEWARLDSDLALVALVVNDRLILPWEERGDREAPVRSLQAVPFADVLADGQRSEFGLGDLTRALVRYAEARQISGAPVQEGYCRLAAARVLFKLDRVQEAREELDSVLGLSPGVRDEFNVPLSFYAAGQALQINGQAERILSVLSKAVAPEDTDVPGLSPAALWMARDYLAQLRRQRTAQDALVAELHQRLEARVARHSASTPLLSCWSWASPCLALTSGGELPAAN